MAKDTFVIYKSFYRPISRLSDKQLGRLFRAIFQYQIDGEATVEEDIEMAFEFFKNQFEIDESKYQGIVERNRSNGRKGVNARSERQSKQANGSDRYPNKPVGAKQANGSLNDYDNDNDYHPPIPPEGVVGAVDVGAKKSEIVQKFFSKQIALESFCMHNNTDPEDLRRLIDEIFAEWELVNEKDISEKHLVNTLRIKLSRKHETDRQIKTDRFSERRGTDPDVSIREVYSDSL